MLTFMSILKKYLVPMPALLVGVSWSSNMFAKYSNCVVSKSSKGVIFRKLGPIMRNTQRNNQCVTIW